MLGRRECTRMTVMIVQLGARARDRTYNNSSEAYSSVIISTQADMFFAFYVRAVVASGAIRLGFRDIAQGRRFASRAKPAAGPHAVFGFHIEIDQLTRQDQKDLTVSYRMIK